MTTRMRSALITLSVLAAAVAVPAVTAGTAIADQAPGDTAWVAPADTTGANPGDTAWSVKPGDTAWSIPTTTVTVQKLDTAW